MTMPLTYVKTWNYSGTGGLVSRYGYVNTTTASFSYTTYPAKDYIVTATLGKQPKGWRQMLKINPVLVGTITSTETRILFNSRAFYDVELLRKDNKYTQWSMQYCIDDPGTPYAFNLDAEEEAIEIATKQLYTRYHSATRAIQGGVFLGELHELIRLIRHPAELIRDLTTLFLRKGFSLRKVYYQTIATLTTSTLPGNTINQKIRRLTKKLQKDIAALWLWYQFGMKPLIQDAQDAADHFRYFAEEKPLFFGVINASATVRKQNASPVVSRKQVSAVNFCYYKFTNISNSYATVKLRAAYQILSSASVGIVGTERLGAGIRDFVPTIWELLPYSFLVDYLVNVSEVIEAWSYVSVFPYGYQRTRIRITERENQGYTPDNSAAPHPYFFGTVNMQSKPVSRRTKVVVRENLQSLTVPTLHLSANITETRFYNIIAILRQGIK